MIVCVTLVEALTSFPHDEPREVRYQRGKELRRHLPRAAHAEVPAADQRPDPVALVSAQDQSRVQQLVPIRYGRMSASPFAFLRGSATVMASDLSLVPRSEMSVQVCGDAHLSNFGMYASPERSLVFDINDFDEATVAPFEWDLKRLAASAALVGRLDSDYSARQAAAAAVHAYQQTIRGLHGMSSLDAWHLQVEVQAALSFLRAHKNTTGDLLSTAAKAARKAETKTSLTALDKITTVVDGQRRIVSQPPLIVSLAEIQEPGLGEELVHVLTTYVETLDERYVSLLRRFRIVDVAHKVVGVGSVGTRCLVILLQGGDGEPLFLQAKEAGDSALAPYVPPSVAPSRYELPSERVVRAQRLLQASSDELLGWSETTGGRSYYIRQWHDMKGSIDPLSLDAEGLAGYAALCGAVLARAHGRSGDASVIAGYIGKGKQFVSAVTDFALAYTDLVSSDFGRLQQAIADGEVPADVETDAGTSG